MGRSKLGCIGECIKEAVQAGIVSIGCRVACGGDNADLDVFAEKVCEMVSVGEVSRSWMEKHANQPWDDGASWFEAFPVLVESHVAVKCG